MKTPPLLFGAVIACLLASCSTPTFTEAELSASEQNLLTAFNNHRRSLGKQELKASASLTKLAREDAARRVSEGSAYRDHRGSTGYERLATLAGTARGDQNFGQKLIGFWKDNPEQAEWMAGSFAMAGVGSAKDEEGLEAGVILLGGY